MYNSLRIIFYLSFCLTLFGNCAEVSSPQGGPKDEQAPVLLKASPPNKSVSIRPEKVVLTFDEYVTVKDAFTQVLLSPPMSANPIVSTKGKSIIVEFPDPFLDNKTYTLNFGDAIRDQNEGNILGNFQYVFSTGEVLDSLSISGTVQDAREFTPEAGMLVLLFPDGERDIVRNERPYYFSRTGTDGRFTINNLQEGRYHILALADQNFNYRFDLPNEKIGFLDTLIVVDSLERSYKLLTFNELGGNGQLSRIRNTRYGKAEANFQSAADTTALTYSRPDLFLTQWNKNLDTLVIWITDLSLDSMGIRQQMDTMVVERRIALKTVNPDTLRMEQKLSISTSLPIPLGTKGNSTALNTSTVLTYDLGKDLLLTFGSPVFSLDSQKVLLTDLQSEDTLSLSLQWMDPLKTILKINADYQAEQLIKLSIQEFLATDIYGLSNDTLSFKFQLRAKKEYGRINLKVQLPEPYPGVIELIGSSGKVVRQSPSLPPGAHELRFEFLTPGNYKVRYIEDLNNNGKWDPGNYERAQQAEKIVMFSENISLRGDWTLDFEWSVSAAQLPDNQ